MYRYFIKFCYSTGDKKVKGKPQGSRYDISQVVQSINILKRKK